MFWIIEVKSSGMYNNVTTGIRLYLTKRSCINSLNLFKEFKCKVEYYPLMRLTGDCFGKKKGLTNSQPYDIIKKKEREN